MRRKRVISDINVVPYIDVMLVLLVIFMVTAPLLQQGVEVDLPDAEQSETIDIQADEEPVMLSVDRNGSMYLNIGGEPDMPLDGQTIVARVTAWRNINPQATVLIRGDGGADYKQVMDAMVLLQRAGVDTIGLVTESPATEP